MLYFAVDVFLLFAVIGLFRSDAGRGLLGRIGCALMFVALVILIARDIQILRAAVYAIGAGLFSLGLVLFAVQLLRNHRFPLWVPLAWILSTVAGAIGFFTPGSYSLFAISGLLFGLAFAAAGVVMWRLRASVTPNSRRRM